MRTFRQSYDRLINAWVKGLLDPGDPCNCAGGTILNNTSSWCMGRNSYVIHDSKGVPTWKSKVDPFVSRALELAEHDISVNSEGTYTIEDIAAIESVFMTTHMREGVRNSELTKLSFAEIETKREVALFKALEAVLLKLREIHEQKGEIIEDYKLPPKKTVGVTVYL